MALFPLSVVLSPTRRLYEPEAAGFRLRRTTLYASAKTPARHCERSGEAGGLVRPSSVKKLLIFE